MVPLNQTCMHCLQHSGHHFNLYYDKVGTRCDNNMKSDRITFVHLFFQTCCLYDEHKFANIYNTLHMTLYIS